MCAFVQLPRSTSWNKELSDPHCLNCSGEIPRHIFTIVIFLKAASEKQKITPKGIPIRITADLSIDIVQARREWQDILKVMKENNLQPRLLYLARISFY